jgi:hypothetical protein
MYLCAPRTRTWHVSTLPHHLSGRPPTEPLRRLLAFGEGKTSDVGPPPTGHLRSDSPLLLGLCVVSSILQTRQRWAATFLSEGRFIWKCTRGWALIWESQWEHEQERCQKWLTQQESVRHRGQGQVGRQAHRGTQGAAHPADCE